MQASILSLVPYHLLWSLSDVPNLKAINLCSLVSWVRHFSVYSVQLNIWCFMKRKFLKVNVLYLQFHRTFCVTAQSSDRGSFKSNLAFTIQDHVGTAEEVLRTVLCWINPLCLYIFSLTVFCITVYFHSGIGYGTLNFVYSSEAAIMSICEAVT